MKRYFIKSGFILIGILTFSNCASSERKSTTTPQKAGATYPAQKIGTTATSSHSRVIGKDKHGMPTYSDASRTRYLRATAYSHMEKEPGAPGRKNAAGTTLKYGTTRSAAADWSRLPLGTKFKTPSCPGITFVIDDYGSALTGTNTIDFFFPSLRKMNKWGTRKVTIQIIQMGSYERSARLLKGRLHAAHCRKMYYAIMRKKGSNIAKN